MASVTTLEHEVRQARKARDVLQHQVAGLSERIDDARRSVERLEREREELVVPANAGDAEAQARLDAIGSEIVALEEEQRDLDRRRARSRQDLDRATRALAQAEDAAGEEASGRRIQELESEIAGARSRLQGLMDALLPELERALEADRELVPLRHRHADEWVGPSRGSEMPRELATWLHRNLGTVLPQEFDRYRLWHALGNQPLELRLSDDPAVVKIED